MSEAATETKPPRKHKVLRAPFPSESGVFVHRDGALEREAAPDDAEVKTAAEREASPDDETKPAATRRRRGIEE